MNATARDFFQSPLADTKGMEDLFENKPGQALGLSQEAPVQASGFTSDRYIEVAVEEASTRLGLSVNAIHKRLRKGSLPGRKVPGRFKDQWLVRILDVSQEEQGLSQEELGLSQEEPRLSQEEPGLSQEEPGLSQEEPGLSQEEPGLSQEEPGLSQEEPVQASDYFALKTHLEIIEKENVALKNQLQGAAYRNGYLEAQLEAERHQVKLLTDSQHQPSWWTKFKSWFMGSP